ncbi:MAG: hypothetical protein IT195_12140 [Microthrixaceae bacterium]|nr:hypothetical protein [Microthrixaceae bacterium]
MLPALVTAVAVATACGGAEGTRQEDPASTPTTEAASAPSAGGPLPSCEIYPQASELLSDPSIQIEAAFSITQGDIIFVAMQVADGNDSPVVLARLANGTWEALDARSSAASGRAEAAGEDPGASMGSLGAQKAVSCLSTR